MASASDRTRPTSLSNLRESIKYRSGNGSRSGTLKPEQVAHRRPRGRIGRGPEAEERLYTVHILVDVIIGRQGWGCAFVVSTLQMQPRSGSWFGHSACPPLALRRCEAADDQRQFQRPAGSQTCERNANGREAPALIALPAVRRGLQRIHSGRGEAALSRMSLPKWGLGWGRAQSR
jgi:hypothetical protein